MRSEAVGWQWKSPSTPRNLIALAAWLGVCFGAAAFGTLFMPGEWYAQLRKPSWNPPNWVFGPVWTTLYAMMAVAAWRVWQVGGLKVQRWPLALFLIQLAFNAIWSWLFFGSRRMDLAFIDITLLLVSLTATMIAFWRVRPLAGVLLVPYWLWVAFASFLNLTLWRMNT